MSNEEKCFCCDNTLSGGSEGVSAGVTRYSCPSCGWYCIEDNIRDSLDRDEKFKLACLLCERRLHEKSPVFISSDSSQEAGLDGISSIYRICNKGELLAEFPRPEQLVSRVLLNMNCILEWPYEMIGIKESKYRFCFFVHFGQLKVLFEDLKSRGYINEHYWDVYKSVALTSIAWQKISELEDSAKKSVDSNQCFVAMWFNDAMDCIYNEGIKPAVEEAGYECKRIDKVPHNNKIDDEIIAAINQSNFLELECEAAKLSISELVRNDVKYKDFFDVQLALNLRLVNFLSSVRLYTDQLASHVSKCSQSDDSIKETIKKLISKEYDLCFEYRFMEALRNHVQHRDIPVHCVSRNSRRVGTDDWLIESSLHFGAKKEILLRDGVFKKTVLNEMPDEVDLKSATRIYTEAINRIHIQARNKINDFVNDARGEMDRAKSDYKTVSEKDAIGLCAYKYQGGEIVEKVYILTKWDDVRRELVHRNIELVNLKKRYISSQAR